MVDRMHGWVIKGVRCLCLCVSVCVVIAGGANGQNTCLNEHTYKCICTYVYVSTHTCRPELSLDRIKVEGKNKKVDSSKN